MINKQELPAELHACFDFVGRWCKQNGAEFIKAYPSKVVWSDDYLEYSLFLNILDVPIFDCTNIEMVTTKVYQFCVPDTEEKFLRIMNALNDHS